MKFSRQSRHMKWLGFLIAFPSMFMAWVRGRPVTYRPLAITIETDEERAEYERDPEAFIRRALEKFDADSTEIPVE
jgi:hypothetical protein